MTPKTQHSFRKKWGQHFLTDTNLLRKVVRLINPEENDIILEIGPGQGALTERILPYVRHMAAIEIDPKLIIYLQGRRDLQDCHFIHRDVLQQQLDELPVPPPNKVIGNIPYNITSPILFWLIEQRVSWTTAFLMVQKEIADRLTSTVGAKSNSRLRVMVGAFLKVQHCFTVPPDVFIPNPNVHSTIIKLVKRTKPHVDPNDFDRFEEIVGAAFSTRRKMLKNSLSGFEFSSAIKQRINFSRRPETLSITEFADLVNNQKQ